MPPHPRPAGEFISTGDQAWAIRAFRELDDVLLRLRLNEPEIGTVIVRASGDPRAQEAIELFVYQITKHLGALTAVLGGIDVQ